MNGIYFGSGFREFQSIRKKKPYKSSRQRVCVVEALHSTVNQKAERGSRNRVPDLTFKGKPLATHIHQLDPTSQELCSSPKEHQHLPTKYSKHRAGRDNAALSPKLLCWLLMAFCYKLTCRKIHP